MSRLPLFCTICVVCVLSIAAPKLVHCWFRSYAYVANTFSVSRSVQFPDLTISKADVCLCSVVCVCISLPSGEFHSKSEHRHNGTSIRSPSVCIDAEETGNGNIQKHTNLLEMACNVRRPLHCFSASEMFCLSFHFNIYDYVWHFAIWICINFSHFEILLWCWGSASTSREWNGRWQRASAHAKDVQWGSGAGECEKKTSTASSVSSRFGATMLCLLSIRNAMIYARNEPQFAFRH